MNVLHVGNGTGAETTRRVLARAPQLRLESVETAAGAIERLGADPPCDAILAEVPHRAADTLALLWWARMKRPSTALVAVVPAGEPDVATRALRTGADDWVAAGCEELLLRLAHAVERTRDRARSAAASGEARYRIFFEGAPVGVAEAELESGTLLQVNDALCEILGYRRDELMALSVRDLTHPDDWKPTVASYHRLVSGEDHRYVQEKRYRHRNGHYVWVRVEAAVVPDASGRPPRGVAVIRDVTQRRQAQEALRQRDELLSAVFQSLSAHVVVLDRAGTITYASRSWAAFAEANGAPLACVTVGVNYLDVCRRASTGDPAAAATLDGLEAVLAGRAEAFTTEYPCPGPHGEAWFLMHANPMPREHGGLVISHTDITSRKQSERALAEQTARYREIFEGARVSMWETDYTGVAALIDRLRAAGVADLRAYLREHREILRGAMGLVRVLDVNGHAVRLHEAPDKATLLAHPEAVIGPELEEAFLEQVQALADGRPYLESEAVVRTYGGGRRHVVYTMTFPQPPRPPDRVLFSAIDITRRKAAEQALQASEARYRTLVESQTEMICRYLPDTTLTFVNDAYCRYFGRTRDELLGARFIEMIPETDRAAVMEQVAGHGDAPRTTEHAVLLPDGSIGWQQWVDRAFLAADGSVVELQGIGRDITMQKHAQMALLESEEALRRSRDQIQDLAGRLLSAQEEERRRISRELHDDMNQKIAALAIGIGQVHRRLPPALGLSDQLAALQRRAITLADDVRRLSHDLHPAILQHAGLAAALRAHCATFGAGSGIEVALEIGAGLEGLPDDVALCLYRVAQEALRNTAKHSGARAARLALSRVDGVVTLAVQDRGRGFAGTADPSGATGIGLVSIAERVRLLHGSLEIHSAPGKGTELLVRVPLRGLAA
jgi:PAS domain S-box-containing protein